MAVPYGMNNLQNQNDVKRREVRSRPESPLSRKKRERKERIEEEKKDMAKLLTYDPYGQEQKKKRIVQFHDDEYKPTPDLSQMVKFGARELSNPTPQQQMYQP